MTPEPLTRDTCERELPVRYTPPGEIDGELYRLNGLPFCSLCMRIHCDCGEPLLVNLCAFEPKQKKCVPKGNRKPGNASTLKQTPRRNLRAGVLLSRCVEYPTPNDIEKACLEFQDGWTEAERQQHINRTRNTTEPDEVELPRLNSINRGRVKLWA